MYVSAMHDKLVYVQRCPSMA